MQRRIPFTHMAFATAVGVFGGVYIYRPYFEPQQKSSAQQNRDGPQNPSQLEESGSPVSVNPGEAEVGGGAVSVARGLSHTQNRTDIKASAD
ncbi:protein PIGBOS1 [Lampris incognitus]|uniref:protein PIGBOS1 n=1 Tax=Lampris incognitus TaxID=2546036 RepID=UPI0024B58C39|nr:protein PIGBOS1 [Lampris incognitus]XP_056135427.1 protein PIGBOS1 [Lampris incognitus]